MSVIAGPQFELGNLAALGSSPEGRFKVAF